MKQTGAGVTAYHTFVLPPRPRHSAQTNELLPVPVPQDLALFMSALGWTVTPKAAYKHSCTTCLKRLSDRTMDSVTSLLCGTYSHIAAFAARSASKRSYLFP